MIILKADKKKIKQESQLAGPSGIKVRELRSLSPQKIIRNKITKELKRNDSLYCTVQLVFHRNRYNTATHINTANTDSYCKLSY